MTEELRHCTSHEQQLAVGRRVFLAAAAADDAAALGEQLRAHPLTRTLLRLAATPRSLSDLAQDLEPSWVATTEDRRAAARHAVALYLALLSRARTTEDRPLLGVDVQLWVREVSRLVRRLSSSPQFRWHDGGIVEDEVRALPSVYCRHCGRSGWGVIETAG
ncbi:MAG: hypothetical protein LC799_15885, partial [Actinobacteria bacterium]|nr:hypothetical protein [Actinomycetota bacterium]